MLGYMKWLMFMWWWWLAVPCMPFVYVPLFSMLAVCCLNKSERVKTQLRNVGQRIASEVKVR